MPYRICKTFEVESGHMLSKHPEKCRFPHGHSRKIEFTLEADELDSNDMVCDFKVIKDLMRNFLEKLDHAMCMNVADPKFDELRAAYGERIIGFADRDPTTEVLAKHLFDHCREAMERYRTADPKDFPLGRDVRLIKVRLWETSNSWAEFSSDERAGAPAGP